MDVKMRLHSSLIKLQLASVGSRAFLHLGSLWSTALAGLLCANILADGDWVTCVSSFSHGCWSRTGVFPDDAETPSLHASDSLATPAGVFQVKVAWLSNSAQWLQSQLCPGPKLSYTGN